MVFYFLVYRGAVSGVSRKVVGITVGGKKFDKIDDVDTLHDLMYRKAMPVGEVHFRGWYLSPLPEYTSHDDRLRKDETLGETLARMKSGETISDLVKASRKNAANRDAAGSSEKVQGTKSGSVNERPSQVAVSGRDSRVSRDDAVGDYPLMRQPSFSGLKPSAARDSLRGCMQPRNKLRVATHDDIPRREIDQGSSTRRRGDLVRGNSSGKRSSVRFGTIEIRQYSRVLGDNPACSTGPSISLGWKYLQKSIVLSIDDFEARRKSRRDAFDLRLSVKQRELILCALGYSTRDMIEADRLKKKIQDSRERTVCRLKYSHWEEAVESVMDLFKFTNNNRRLVIHAPQ